MFSVDLVNIEWSLGVEYKFFCEWCLGLVNTVVGYVYLGKLVKNNREILEIREYF